MAVRFLPPQGDSASRATGDRENLAEVIELRSRLRPADPESDADAAKAPRATRRVVQIAELRASTDEIQAAHEAEALAGDESRDETESVRTATDDAVRMLARRARSAGELRRELLALGHDHAEVEEVVLECESRLYLDDLGLARVLTETLRARKRASRSQIRLKLRERLLPDGVIEEVLGELDDDEENDLLFAAANERVRKMGGLDRQTAERRLLGFLARRGWSGERAIRVAREALDRDARRGHSSLAPERSTVTSSRNAPSSDRGISPMGRGGASSNRSSVRFH